MDRIIGWLKGRNVCPWCGRTHYLMSFGNHKKKCPECHDMTEKPICPNCTGSSDSHMRVVFWNLHAIAGPVPILVVYQCRECKWVEIRIE